MKQLFQNLKTGQTFLEEIPIAGISPGFVQIQSVVSLVSLGTERMLVSFSQANLIDKARQQPERVKMVIDKIQSDGLIPTLEAVFSRLDEPLPLGYCNAGVVIGVGKGVHDLKVGDRVISNGSHAEIVTIPRNLVAKIPDEVNFENAAFTVLGSIGLQGLRLAAPQLGETVLVIGLGLVGQLTAQLAKANGCKVIGTDLDNSKVSIARNNGIAALNSITDDIIGYVQNVTAGHGADSVIITASTKSNEIIKQAAKCCRKRGKIILVGVVGLEINRADFYEKELTFQVSCSYGPGRYDDNYEQKGFDYPLPFVRWTENRNFATVLECLKSGTVKVENLITERVKFSDAPLMYSDISKNESIAILLNYQDIVLKDKVITIQNEKCNQKSFSNHQTNGIGIIGAGLFTKSTLLPIFQKQKILVTDIVSKDGASAKLLANKFGIGRSSTVYTELLSNPEIGSVIITTRHDQHGSMVIEALNAGKHVFVEKPLTIVPEDVDKIKNGISETTSIMVGFNRRFSPLVKKIKTLIGDNPVINCAFTFNAGAIPSTHWTQDPECGGGRILGEACHFIDLFSFLANSPIREVCATTLGSTVDIYSDNVSILIKCKNGSQGMIGYFSNGNKAWAKENIEVYHGGKVFRIDNFRILEAAGVKGFKKLQLPRQDKGHHEQFRQYVLFLQKKIPIPISINEIINVTNASFAVLDSLRRGGWVQVGE